MPVPHCVKGTASAVCATQRGKVRISRRLFPRATSQVAMLAWIFGDCREGQRPCCKLDTPLLEAGALIIFTAISLAFWLDTFWLSVSPK